MCIGPLEQPFEPLKNLRTFAVKTARKHLKDFARRRGYLPTLNLSRQPIERQVFTFAEFLFADTHTPPRLIDFKLSSPNDRRPSHLAPDHRCVRSHPTRRRQHALGHVHAMNVIRHSLPPDEQDGLALP
tara:strand:+ start:1480 stop:1866 length:387 start_codon:yes stop_codon:yes gene_type:complete